MSRRDQIRMSDAEVRAFLEEQRTLQVATIGPGGFPHVVAMWYIVRDGEIVFWTDAKSQKAVNLRRDPRLTCLVEAGDHYAELQGVQVKGRAELISDTSRVQRIGEAIYTRYTGPLTDETRRVVTQQAPKRIAVVVHPVAVVSWDHRKLGGIR
jgi:PPOX class probable F420-dependent enzyme